MKTFAEKVKDARAALEMTQGELAEKIGISVNAVSSYEKGIKTPRASTMEKLAAVLQVSITFLTDDTCEDPLKDIEKDGYIKKAREQYGNSGAKQAQALTAELSGLFAGGDIAEEDMDAMMKAVMDAYWIAKEKNKKFAPKKAQTDK